MTAAALALGRPEAANAPGVALTRWRLDCRATATAFTGDGEHAAFGLEDGSVRLVMLKRYAARRMIAAPIHDGAVIALAGGEGGEIASLGADGRAVMVDGAGFAAEIYEPPEPGLGALAFHVADGRIALATPAAAWLLDGAGREIDRLAVDRPRAVALAPGARRMAIATADSVLVWRRGESRPPRRLGCREPRGLVWSCGGRRLAALTAASSLPCWRFGDDGGIEETTLLGRPRMLAWCGNGRALVGDGEEGLLRWCPQRTAPGRGWHAPTALLPMSGRRLTALACHPRHALAATAYDDGCVLLADLDGGRERLVRHATGSAARALAWSPDGLRLALAGSGEAAIFDFSELEENST